MRPNALLYLTNGCLTRPRGDAEPGFDLDCVVNEDSDDACVKFAPQPIGFCPPSGVIHAPDRLPVANARPQSPQAP